MKNEWDAIATQWDQNRTTPSSTLAFFRPYAHGIVLDAGCGNGRNSLQWAKTAHRVIALDASTAMAHIAKKNLMDVKNTGVIQAKIEKMPQDDESIDSVFCLAALHHVKPKDQPNALAEFFRVLKPGGHLCLTVWNRQQKRFRKKSKELDVPWEGKPRYYYLYDEIELTALLENAGLQIEQIIYEKNGKKITPQTAQNLCVIAVKK